MIAGKLTSNVDVASYFNDWGNRCYLFISELGKKYHFPKGRQQWIQELAIEVSIFKSLGGKYILAACPIKNYDQLGFRLIDYAQHKDDEASIFVYELMDNDDPQKDAAQGNKSKAP